MSSFCLPPPGRLPPALNAAKKHKSTHRPGPGLELWSPAPTASPAADPLRDPQRAVATTSSKYGQERAASTACSAWRQRGLVQAGVTGFLGSASRLLVHAENQTSRATQTKLWVMTPCLKACQGAIKKYVFPAEQHRSSRGCVVTGDLLPPLTTAKSGYKRGSPSQPGAFGPRHWLAQNCTELQEESAWGGNSRLHPPVKWMLPWVFPLLDLLHA